MVGLAPSIFENEEAGVDEIDEDDLNWYLCRLVGVLRQSLLPTQTHDIEATHSGLLAALSQHFTINGGLPDGLTLDDLKKGYYAHLENGKDIICLLDDKTGAQRTKMSLNHCDRVEIANVLDAETEIRCTTHGTVMKIDSMGSTFREEGLPIPTLEVDWKGALFGTPKAKATPTKKRPLKETSSPGDASGSCTSPTVFSSKNSVMLSDALRRRVAKKESPKKETGGSSGSGR